MKDSRGPDRLGAESALVDSTPALLLSLRSVPAGFIHGVVKHGANMVIIHRAPATSWFIEPKCASIQHRRNFGARWCSSEAPRAAATIAPRGHKKSGGGMASAYQLWEAAEVHGSVMMHLPLF
jgi:hypothetical protein